MDHFSDETLETACLHSLEGLSPNPNLAHSMEVLSAEVALLKAKDAAALAGREVATLEKRLAALRQPKPAPITHRPPPRRPHGNSRAARQLQQLQARTPSDAFAFGAFVPWDA